MDKQLMETYRNYVIQPKLDFGNQPFLIRGEMVSAGFVVVFGDGHEYKGCNAMPGATWFRTIGAARLAIDVLEEAGVMGFWTLYRERYPVEKYNSSEFERRDICARVYLFANQDDRDTAANILETAFVDLIRKNGWFSVGWNQSSHHFLTVYFKVPADIDAAIQKFMGFSEPVDKMYVCIDRPDFN